MDVAGNQTASMTGTDSFQGSIAPAQPDAFLTAMLNAERPPAAPPPQVVASMPGGDDLSAYGTWSDTSDYGQVWYPQVAPDWVPYRDGQWAYVEPWGWTWVDSDPWGFAPFHYGRWVDTGGRWGWVPGAPVAGPPVYAPALVTFFGLGAAVGVGIGAALAAGRVGWFPLGPREAYRPWYHASPAYIRNVNIRHVTNITTINRNVAVNNFANRRAATVVPTSAMTSSRPVGRFAQRVDPAQLAQARPLTGTQPARPAATTVGVTPVVARRFNLPASATAARPVAPGPEIRAMPVTARPTAPALHAPAQNAVPAAAAIHPVAAARNARCCASHRRRDMSVPPLSSIPLRPRPLARSHTAGSLRSPPRSQRRFGPLFRRSIRRRRPEPCRCARHRRRNMSVRQPSNIPLRARSRIPCSRRSPPRSRHRSSPSSHRSIRCRSHPVRYSRSTSCRRCRLRSCTHHLRCRHHCRPSSTLPSVRQNRRCMRHRWCRRPHK